MSQDHTRLPPTRGEGQGRKARPVLFSGAMVRALLAGSKTQTRRIVKRPAGVPEDDPTHWVMDGAQRWRDDVPEFSATYWPHDEAEGEWLRCPYGVPGDLLWVKERLARSPDLWTYVADGSEVGWPARQVLASKRLDYAPSIHMPKAASRLTLEITEVRVERLQDISEADARAEGAQYHDGRGIGHSGWRHDLKDVHATAQSAYARLWCEINGAESWGGNPWVWAVSFKVHQQNVDSLSQPHPPGGNSHAE